MTIPVIGCRLICQIPSRSGEIRPREDGAWWEANFSAALDTGLPIVAIETWNEYHEASGIGDSVEYGRTYIEATSALLDEFRAEILGLEGVSGLALDITSKPPGTIEWE